MRNYLNEQRTIKGLSMKRLSERLDISESYYCQIETGKRQQDMTYSMMEKLAAAFEVPIQDIIDAEAAYLSAAKADSA